MELVSRREIFLKEVVNQLVQYDNSDVDFRANYRSINNGTYVNNQPLMFKSLVVYRADYISDQKNPYRKLDVRLFRIANFYFLYIYYYSDELKQWKLPSSVSDFKWCLPAEISLDQIHLFEIGQGGTGNGGLYIQRQCQKEIMPGLIQLVIDNLAIFENISDHRFTKEKIFGSLLTMLSSDSKRTVLELCLKFN